MNIKITSRAMSILIVLALLLSLFVTNTSPVSAAETRNIVILGTSDIHGNVDNYDYFSDSVPTGSSVRGLTKVMTYVKSVLASNANTILIDNGDTIQGTPLAYYYELLHPEVQNPLAATMNAMGFVSSTVGNHEFNYGPTVFNKFQEDADFPLLSANVTDCKDYTFQPYVIKDVDGVQVGILGLTPPAVPHWERPENIVGCVFGDAVDAAKAYVPQMRAAGADVVIVSAHSGLDETYGYGREENFIKLLANEVPDIDVILAGHAHVNVAGDLINGVLVTEPNYHTRNISDIRIELTGSGNDWTVNKKSSTTPAVGPYAEDPGILTITNPYHTAAVAYINTPIGTATAAFPGGFQARIADGPMADLINQVQMEAAAEAGFPVEASLAALFTNTAQLSAGPIKLKDAYAVYIYDNTLYVVDATGQMIKDELEWTASYFNQYYYEPTGVTVNTSVRDYNYDLWSGIEYKLDVTKPVGQRVVELKLNGEPLAMDQVVRIALNNYRATGKFPNAPKLYQSTTEVRELITNWIMEHGTISPSDVFKQNFALLPSISLWQNPDGNVTRTDNADLLWTAFDGSIADYMKLPGDKNTGGVLTREGGLYLLGNRAMDGLWDIAPDMSVLQSYTDKNALSSWAKVSTAYALQAWIFTPEGNQLLPKQTLTNAEALAWVREARYPYYTFLSTNDFHGQLLTGQTVSSKPVGGAAFNMTYINQYKDLNPYGTLLMDAGDIMQGTPISNLLWGASVIDVYNQMGYDVATTGNHEFDWGQTRLQERITQAEFPFVVANIFTAGTDTRPSWAVPTVLFDVKGQQIGVIGVTSKDTPSIVMPGNLAGLEFRPVGPIVAQYAAELRAAGADIVVVLAHMPDVTKNTQSQLVAAGEIIDVAQPGVDLIISGHNHTGVTGRINGIPLMQEYSSGTAIGVSNLSYDRRLGTVVNSALQVVTTYNEGVVPDPEIAAAVGAYEAELSGIMNAVKASTLGPISYTTDAAGQSPMGNLIADAQRWKGGTQIAFMNPGGVRKPIQYASYPHDITFGDFFIVQPFDNKLMTFTLTGEQIWAVLEQQFMPHQPGKHRVLMVSGIHFTYNLANVPDSRITSLTLDGGGPIAKDATTYTVTASNYLTGGGDNFSAFLGSTNLYYTGVSDLDALIEYVQYLYGAPGDADYKPIDPTVYPIIDDRVVKQ